MDRIKDIFESCRQAERKALIVFASCGCPDMETSEAVIEAIIGSGADIVELGVPFSDPMADGAVIQHASQLALERGAKFADILELAARVRQRHPGVGLVLFSYYNILFNYGPEKLAAEAVRIGLDGILCVDLPFEERDELKLPCDRHGLHLIPLLSPATPIERAAKIVADATGFVYYVTVRGVTGERSALPVELAARLAEIRRVSPVPVAAGFGIGTPAAAKTVGDCADAVVVGSAAVKLTLSGESCEKIVGASSALVASLAAALGKG